MAVEAVGRGDEVNCVARRDLCMRAETTWGAT